MTTPDLAAIETLFKECAQPTYLDHYERRRIMPHFPALASARSALAALKRREEDVVRLVEAIAAHEIESMSCDRDGETHCECVRAAATALSPAVTDRADQGGEGK